MDAIDKINRFLQYTQYERGKLRSEEKKPGIRPFITISRQAGAGGLTIAQALVDAFAEHDNKQLFGEWQVFDQKLVERMVDESNLKVSLDSLLSEDYQTRADDFFKQALTAKTPQDTVMEHVFRRVRDLAEVGKVIIVGRAGAQATQGLGPCVSMCLIAPEKMRVNRMMEVHDLAKKPARKLARKHDAGRARLLKRHFKVDANDALQYDMTLNTGKMSPKAIVQAVIAVLQERVAEFDMAESTQQ